MVETRVDPETGEWDVIAPRRSARPVDRPGGPVPCPFCPGNEAMTPPEVLRVPAGADTWRVRVFPNLYALVATDDELVSEPALPFTGQHEVVVESARHDWDLRFGTPDEVADVLFAMRERCRTLAARQPAAISVFRNYGARAGASLAHPHSQIVALDQAPPALVRRWRRAREHYEQTGRCLHDDLATAERREGTRVVSDAEGVLVWQPYAAAVPHHTMLLPADDSPDLASASDDAVAAMARVLPRVLTGLATVLDDPAYNLVFHSGPTDTPTARDWYRWHVAIYPRVTTRGGLELATGVAVNPTAPEETAPALRRALSG
ncbi:galactose-1-phosphate uridylyltransferase [Planosporangium flavigriseum]|uniref:Galactose-1-phosphate uridylyltransferase n=1 Tax=Planosporangium flavigriseum TaxID=373681 RepID=A0A8J3PPW3_9ACTN|nr:galactose-1-phosphate uridylyltransferase [Planosporangium flavigriseum]NJC67296.1 galactose-1-phosphate uridylyltransferase [Planosporangium flavigriseum]GIG76789.1 galactose-1-phosphate uridylyltransferase [Planosporangium flavigriseum]